MRDWAEGDEARNYQMEQRLVVQGLSRALTLVLLLAATAGGAFVCIRTRSQNVAIERRQMQLDRDLDFQLRLQRGLIAWQQHLENPERIETIARNRLGMVPLDANQLLPAPLPAPGPAEMAMAGPSDTQSPQLRSRP